MSRSHNPPGPQRTCIGCRAKAEKATMVRIVWDRAQGRFVTSGQAPGRGAYVHADPACLAEAQRRRALARALRVPNPPATTLADLIGGPTRERL